MKNMAKLACAGNPPREAKPVHKFELDQKYEASGKRKGIAKNMAKPVCAGNPPCEAKPAHKIHLKYKSE